MKRFYVLIISTLAVISLSAHKPNANYSTENKSGTVVSTTVEVLFEVDMSLRFAENGFNPDSDKVYLAGNFTNWGDNKLELTRKSDSLVYSIVAEINPDASVEFKFILNDAWENANGSANRSFIYDSENPHYRDFYNQESGSLLTFAVDMQYQVAQGNFDPATQDVYFGGLQGDNWQIFTTKAMGNNVYARSFHIKDGTAIEYKFRIGTDDLDYESIENRTYTAGSTDQTIRVAFNDEYPLILEVDLSAQSSIVNPKVGYRRDGSIWTDIDLKNSTDEIYATTFYAQSGVIFEYKFKNNSTYELDGSGNRPYTTLRSAETLRSCFDNQSNITFKVDMSNYAGFDADHAKMYVFGSFNGWSNSDELTAEGNNIYSVTKAMGHDSYTFKYRVDTDGNGFNDSEGYETISDRTANLSCGGALVHAYYSDDEPACGSAPSVSTGEFNLEIGSTECTINGTVSDYGGNSIISAGACWSTSAEPDIEDSKTTSCYGLEDYCSTASELTPNEIYYIRTYVENACGTTYGDEIKFRAGHKISDLVISEYIEGSDDNKFIELYNGTNSSVDLSDYKLYIYRDGSSLASEELSLPAVNLASNEVYLISNGSQTKYNQTVDLVVESGEDGYGVMQFDGNDPIGLYQNTGKKSTGLLDVVGTIGSADIFAAESGLRRSNSVTSPSITFDASDWTEVEVPDDISGLGNPLPVTLSDFWADENSNSVVLNWETASELNADYFELQRSIDGVRFEIIDEIKAVGNSSITQHYSAIDYHPYKPIGYYRLNTVDYDGSSEFSKVISSSQSMLANEISARVYHSHGQLIINIASEQLNEVTIKLTNALGENIHTEYFTDLKPDTDYSVGISNTYSGIYIVSIISRDTAFSTKILLK